MVKNERTTYGIIGIAAIAALSLLVAGSASANFHGTDITTTWELWNGASPGDGGSLLAVTDTATVTASDSVIPDISDFHDSTGTTNELWDVEFLGNTISLTYTSIYVQDADHQYMYMMPVGFHFSDLTDNLPQITGVTVDDSFAPLNFDPLKVAFGNDDIWVNLQGSMCHVEGMPMPACDNASSPTGYDNRIVLTVSTVPEPGTATLLLLGLGGLGFASRRQGSSSQ